MTRTAPFLSAVPFLIAVTTLARPERAAAQAALPSSACDQSCLSRVMSDFLGAVTTGKPGAVPLADNAEVRENTKLLPLAATSWKDVRAIRSVMTFSDPVAGNVVSRAGVELSEGKAGYISTRLKVMADGRITDVELSADTSLRVVSSYVWKLDPQFEAVLPPEQRMSRVALEALGRRYFQSLSSHVAVAQDFDERCNRFHSGQQITNAGRNTVEGGPPRTCASSLEGNPPWGPATELRLPVIDPERGIVFGVTLLHYPSLPNQPQMYVSELFKVVSGRIVKIDNIGLMMQSVSTLGFTH